MNQQALTARLADPILWIGYLAYNCYIAIWLTGQTLPWNVITPLAVLSKLKSSSPITPVL